VLTYLQERYVNRRVKCESWSNTCFFMDALLPVEEAFLLIHEPEILNI